MSRSRVCSSSENYAEVCSIPARLLAPLHSSPLRHFTARSGRHDTRLQHETGIFIVQVITTASGIVILTQIAILFRKVRSGGSMI